MPPPPGLTKADVANLIELYQNEEGQTRFAVYVGKPGPRAWCLVKDLAEARRKAGDMNSVQSVAIREGQPLTPTISFADWRVEQQTGSPAEPVKANGKGRNKGKGRRPTGPSPTADDDVDALVASIEAVACEEPAPQLAKTPDQAGAAAELCATTPVAAAAAAPEPSGRRVCIDGLQARPELNGRCGVARRFDVAKGRYEVVVEGEAEPLLLKPANLHDVAVAAAAPEPLAEPAAESAGAETGAAGAARLSEASTTGAEAGVEAEVPPPQASAASAGGDAEAAARETARSDVEAKVAAARAAQVLDEAVALARLAQQEEEGRQQEGRKLKLGDLLTAEEEAGFQESFENNEKFDNTHVKDFRMQGEFGAKKFIKP